MEKLDFYQSQEFKLSLLSEFASSPLITSYRSKRQLDKLASAVTSVRASDVKT